MFRVGAIVALVSLSAGCAKFPGGPPGGGGKRIEFTILLDAPVNPNYVYIFAINDGDDLTGAQGGPLPIIRPPWGNGFCAPKATHFIRYDGFQPSGGYAVFKFIDLVNLLTFVNIGIPVSFTTPDSNSRVLEFAIDLSQLRPPPADPNDILALQINLMTMDRVITNPNDPGPKFWDALGDSRLPTSIDDYITIDTTVDRVYRNSDANIEPQGDVIDPALDIVDWTIRVRSQ
jgi:hypothetical protein